MTGNESADAAALTRVHEQLSVADSVEAVTHAVTAAVRELMGADGATFVLREDGHCFYVDENAISPLWKGSRFPLSTCISGWAMLNQQVVVIEDIYTDDRIPHDAYRPTFVKSLCMAPVRAAAPIGALGAYWSESTTPSPQDVRKLQMLANSAAIALENLELRDTVARRNTERDTLAERSDELESAIHTLAHDLRSPLGAIIGYAELLEDTIEDAPDKAQVFARTIHDAGQRLAQQIDRMLGLYRITSTPLEIGRVDLSALCRDVVRPLEHRAGEREVEFVIADDLVVSADPVLLHILVENLLSNAFKYSGRTASARIEVGLDGVEGGFGTFFVRDNGAGFDPDQAHRLFHPMSRLHSEEEFPGNGLGLASSARIAQMHGGRMWAQGALGEGATFWFTLPLAA